MPTLLFTILVFAAGGLFGILLMALVSITRPDPGPDIPLPTSPNDHGGERCQHCHTLYQTVWSAPDALWYNVAGPEAGGLLCPACFDTLAREKGYMLYWSCRQATYPSLSSLGQ